MADQSGWDGEGAPDLGVDPDYGDTADVDGRSPADAIAEFVGQQVQERLYEADPLTQAQQAAELQHEAAIEAAAVDIVGRHPALAQPAVANRTITDARAAAAQIGDHALADDPSFWEQCFVARQSGRDDIATAVLERQVKDAIVNGGGGRGASALPFAGPGGFGTVDHRPEHERR
jgi:hypothetical protein